VKTEAEPQIWNECSPLIANASTTIPCRCCFRSEHVGTSALSKREILELIEAMEAFAEPVEV
jgi:hypothetical protein